MVLLGILADKTAVAAEKSGLPQMDISTYPSQLFWLAIFFGLFYLMMDQIFLPALGGVIEERKNRIADDLDEASSLNQQAEAAETTYRQALADAKTNAAEIAAETRAKLDTEIRQMQAETDAKLASELDAAETRIKNLQEAATTKITEAASDTARAIIEALIDETPTTQTVTAAVARFQ